MIKTTKRARSGFFFAVMALAMLSLVLMTVQIWVKTFEQADYRASQRFKGEAVRSILASLSDQTLTDFANASAFYATYKLVNYTSNAQTPLIRDNDGAPDNNPHTAMVNRTIFKLMLNGTSEPNDGRKIDYASEEKISYTIRGWQEKVAAAVNTMGFDINFSEAKNFSYRQIDAWTVGISFDLDMNITDKEGTMRQNKTMHVKSNFSISGFLDPMISRNDMVRTNGQRELATEKQIFKLDAYNVPADVKPIKMKDGDEGSGWFFGPITEQTLDEIPDTGDGATITNLKQYILVSDYNDSLAGIANSYGAVIVTEEPVLTTTFDPITGCNITTQTKCLNCMRKTEAGPGCPATVWDSFQNNNQVDVPVIAVNNWNTNSVTPVTRALVGGSITERFVLIDNENDDKYEKMNGGYHRVWDITKLRDMAICGFYVKGEGPSFFQRMLAGAPIQNTEGLGIESFVVGQWAGGKDNKNADMYSRLDWEFYADPSITTGPKIKGMMGCKSKEMCIASNPDATDIGVGKFRLSNDAANRYGSALISCGAPASAVCD